MKVERNRRTDERGKKENERCLGRQRKNAMQKKLAPERRNQKRFTKMWKIEIHDRQRRSEAKNLWRKERERKNS